MMNDTYYETIFMRKSFHLFRGVGSERLTPEELCAIEEAYRRFEPLDPGIRTKVRIVAANKVNVRRGAEYCILIYSEEKENFRLNAGYLGEQLDLWLVAHGIGTLWFGIGKPDTETFEGLSYVIMIAIRKISDPAFYRRDLFKAKRRPLCESWEGETVPGAEIARFAPSACNTQPWYVKNENGALTVFRYKKPGKRGIMPKDAVVRFNRIDIGIYLCILEICLSKNGIKTRRELFSDNGGDDDEYTKVAVYRLNDSGLVEKTL